ncbi:MAG: glucosaminidase domain-containing protein [Bacteroidia bacterium]|nr:glucosaminidase domain-containing protein [Bacteroidia bacterium]
MIKAGFSIQKFTLLFLLCSFLKVNAQPPQFKIYVYLEAYGHEAVNQMVEHGIPASVILAQAIYESSSGTSSLARKSNNHFGIKCHREWGGDTITQTDDSDNECFRKYNNVKESYTDHSLFLRSRARYAHLFNLDVRDYKSWCIGLKQSGYATSPTYSENLIKIIEENKLYEFDGYQNLECKVILKRKEPELKQSPYKASMCSLSEFAKSGALWIDPQYVVIRSLDLIVDQDTAEGSEIAGN